MAGLRGVKESLSYEIQWGFLGIEVRAEEREKQLIQSSSSGYHFQKEVSAGKFYGQSPRKLPSWNSDNWGQWFCPETKGNLGTEKTWLFQGAIERLKEVDLAVNWWMSLEGRENGKDQATEGPVGKEVRRRSWNLYAFWVAYHGILYLGLLRSVVYMLRSPWNAPFLLGS